MDVWTVANQKGGVGKTTTTVALGGLLADQGQRVLLVDLDPHTSLTAYFGLDADSLQVTLFDCLQHPEWTREELRRRAIQKTDWPGLDLVGGSIALATLDRQLSDLHGKGYLLQKVLRRVEPDYDHVLIDCPPVLGVLMVNALAVCNRLLIPCQTEPLALKGLERMIQTIGMVGRAGRHQMRYSIIPTMFDKRTRASIQALRVMRDQWPDCLWKGMVPVDTKFRDASQAHVPPHALDPQTHGVQAYARLLRDIRQNKLPAVRPGHESA
jgi:chromosome partitioning protein